MVARTLRIALVILHADPRRGGAERYTRDLAAALAGLGHDVTVLATSFESVPAGVRAVNLEASGATRAGRYRRVLDEVDRVAAPGSFDVVHSMLPVRRCDVYHPHAGLAVDGVGALPLLTWLVNPRRMMMRRVEGELLRGAGAPVVLCLSDAMRRQVRQRYPRLASDRVATLFNGVDLSYFDPGRADVMPWTSADVPSGAPLFVMVAQDFARKGLGAAIGGLAEIGDGDLAPRLVVAGWDDRAQYVREATTLGVAGRVIFAGGLADVRPLYRAATALVLPTWEDPCSLVVLEALAMGVPVISTRANGACEIMTDGAQGYILDQANDTKLLAARMKALLDASKRAEMSAACLALRPKLAFENHLQSLLAIYERVKASTH